MESTTDSKSSRSLQGLLSRLNDLNQKYNYMQFQDNPNMIYDSEFKKVKESKAANWMLMESYVAKMQDMTAHLVSEECPRRVADFLSTQHQLMLHLMQHNYPLDPALTLSTEQQLSQQIKAQLQILIDQCTKQ